MSLPREGSRKRRVYDALQSQGVDEALRIGLETLGLKEASVRAWLKSWTKGELKAVVREDNKPMPKRKAAHEGKQRFVCPSLGRAGVILRAGPDQSEVCFDGDGSERTLPNSWISEERFR